MKIITFQLSKFKKFSLFALAALLSVTLIPLNPSFTSAQSNICDTSFYSGNDILYYNPCSDFCDATSSISSVSSVNKLRGENNGEKVYNFWIDAGMSAQQAAGITANIQNQSGFSAFRQETDKAWLDGGWGIVQFTNAKKGNPGYGGDVTGQRDVMVSYLTGALGEETFKKYYSSTYGGVVLESDGFIPADVPEGINDRFLISELNYLLSYINALKLSSVSSQVTQYTQNSSKTVDGSMTLYDYLRSITVAGEASTAWTYLYDFPMGDIKAISATRATASKDILKLYGGAVSTLCGGGLAEGGMNLDQAKQFMEAYKTGSDSSSFLGGAGRGCPGGPLANCVSFSVYFINKYTSLQKFGADRVDGPGNGKAVVGNAIKWNPEVESGSEPRPYAIFSRDGGKFGHTGVILGVDLERGKVIVGDAGCLPDGSSAAQGIARIRAQEYDLSLYNSGTYRYIYTDGLLKGIEE